MKVLFIYPNLYAQIGFIYGLAFLSAVIKLNMIYDDDIKYVNQEGLERGARAQFKQLFGFGLAYKW